MLPGSRVSLPAATDMMTMTVCVFFRWLTTLSGSDNTQVGLLSPNSTPENVQTPKSEG